MAKPKPRRKPARRGKKRGKFDLSKQLDRGLVSVALSIVSLSLLIAALLAEGLLLGVAGGLSSLATVAHVRWRQQRAEQEQRLRATRVSPKTAKRPRAGGAEPQQPAGQQTGGGVVLCTDTGKPAENCGCASRHVATADGARTFGLPIGSPLGKRAKPAKPAATVQRGAS